MAVTQEASSSRKGHSMAGGSTPPLPSPDETDKWTEGSTEVLKLALLPPFALISSHSPENLHPIHPNSHRVSSHLEKGFRFCLIPPAPPARSGNWACGPGLGEQRPRAAGATGERRAGDPMLPVHRSDP